MSIEFATLADFNAILITVSGHVDAPEVDRMRARTVELREETGFRNFVVDISALQSIARGDTFTTFELGDRFREAGFEYRTKTAVIMPVNREARRQAEFLHTVELNRGRGEIRYVSTIDEAIDWFEAEAES